MRLWTWQNPKLDITDPIMYVESRKYSDHLKSSRNIYAIKHLEKYKKLWSILRTDQFHWYCTNFEEATKKSSLKKYKSKILWELDVPEDEIFKKICSMAWHWLLKQIDAVPPKLFEYLLDDIFWLPTIYDYTTFSNDFNRYWRDISEKQLWDILFYECEAKGCYDVLVCHPVDESWVIKNPRNDISKNSVNLCQRYPV